MTILKDFFCKQCGEVVADVEVQNCSVAAINVPCPQCGRHTSHEAMCNGGLNSRYRYNDWNVNELAKGVKFTGVKACYGNDDTGEPDETKPVTDLKTGKILHEDSKYSPDALYEKRKRYDHADQKRRGAGKLVFGGKK